MAAPSVLLIDNYDSFTWNLYQYLCLLGANVTVVRSRDLTLPELLEQHTSFTHLVISPGPGHPLRDSGISMPALLHFAGKLPILGVCMGLQCIYAAYGGEVDSAGEIWHGKTSEILHDEKGLFAGLPQGIKATRYHSLAGNLSSLPSELEVTSRTKTGIIMGIRHKNFAIEAVQYHPESILSEHGQDMMRNFLDFKSGTWETATTEKPAVTLPSISAVPTILNKIYAQRRLDVQHAKLQPGTTPSDLQTLVASSATPPCINLYSRLLASPTPVSLLAEFKRASPSKGDFLDPTHPPVSAALTAKSYALAGAAVISVLTEPKWFKGSLNDMLAVRRALDGMPNRPAILRKDFVLDTYQIDEARFYGADTILLIVAMLDDVLLTELYDYAKSLGMEPLVEVNNEDELSRALAIGSKVIGVNNRNLHTFDVNMDTTSRLALRLKSIPGGDRVILCALSGITGRKDVEMYAAQGVKGILVGEALMRSQDRGAFARDLLGIPPAVTESTPAKTLVKICGIKDADTALVAAEAGADFLGLVFAPKSKRNVSIETAQDIIRAVRSSPSYRNSTPSSTSQVPEDWFSFQAHRLSSSKRKPLIVGVFQNPSLSELLEVVDSLQLDVVQLHGSEPLEWNKLLTLPSFKAFHVPSQLSATDLSSNPNLLDVNRPGYFSVPLLDTALPSTSGLSGGAGKTFNWKITESITARPEQARLPIILAGGLDLSNIKEAVVTVRPWAVDVSGGVETEGKKDVQKIRDFIRAAKEV